MRRRVSVTRSCEVCGGSFEAIRSTGRYCGNRCRQQAFRDRRRKLAEPVRLTPELRAWLKAQIDRRARERQAVEDELERERAA